jgi:hypothetical protein
MTWMIGFRLNKNSNLRRRVRRPENKRMSKLFGADVKGRYVELKRAAADRCPRNLGTIVKAQEVQFHHEVYNQFLWNQF